MKLPLKIVFVFFALGLCLACGAGKMEQEVTITDTVPVQNVPVPLKMNTDLVMVFTKTNGFRHKSIEKGVSTLRTLGLRNNFVVTHTEDSLDFNSNNLKKYGLVVFLSTTQDVLGPEQEEAFKKYINNGGSFLGIHAAADTEYEWPWYNKLVGAYFLSHPKQQKAKINVVDKTHASTAHLSDTWSHFDEWYNYKSINPDIKVIMKLDESSYEGGENGDDHPIAWYHEYDGGRAFYTGLGHTDEAYDDPKFKKHLVGAIQYCLGRE